MKYTNTQQLQGEGVGSKVLDLHTVLLNGIILKVWALDLTGATYISMITMKHCGSKMLYL